VFSTGKPTVSYFLEAKRLGQQIIMVNPRIFSLQDLFDNLFGAEECVPIIKLTHDPTQNQRIPFIDWRSLGPILKNIISHKNSKNEVA